MTLVKCNDIRGVKELIANGININRRYIYRVVSEEPDVDTEVNTALGVAVAMERFKLTKLLLSEGADPNLETKFEGGVTELACCEEADNGRLLKLVLEAGANPNKTDANGNTSLHFVADWLGGRETHYWLNTGRLVKTLLAFGADVTIKNMQGKTCLECAEEAGNKDFMELINTYLRQNKAKTNLELKPPEAVGCKSEVELV